MGSLRISAEIIVSPVYSIADFTDYLFRLFLVFSPFTHPLQVEKLDIFTTICFIYCCINTLIGYGAYAEALNRWEVAKVSMIVTLVPLFTIVFSHLLHGIFPQYFSAPSLNNLSYIGACIVVFGAMLSAIGHKLIKNYK